MIDIDKNDFARHTTTSSENDVNFMVNIIVHLKILLVESLKNFQKSIRLKNRKSGKLSCSCRSQENIGLVGEKVAEVP